MTHDAATGLTASEVAERLGVEISTVYAYVSRGALDRLPGGEGRRSLYDADQVDELARRTRPRSIRRRTGAIDVVIGTTISEIGDGWIRYRDRDLLELAAGHRYEEVCQLLWTGELVAPPRTDGRDHEPDRSPDPDPDSQLDRDLDHRIRAAVEGLGPAPSIDARLAVAAVAAGSRGEVAGFGVLEALVSSLEVIGEPPPVGAALAARLLPRISPLPATEARVRALDVAMVLLAEHELATSTLAVRVAASTRAPTTSCLLAGLAAVSGPLHGKAAIAVHQRLRAGDEPTAHAPDQGFGHSVHRSGDPRFAPLLAAASGIAAADQRALVAGVGARGRQDPPPNVDAALGALGFVLDAEVGATEAIFAIARTAGWLAHAFEEADEPPLRFRGRTRYRGPR